MLPFTVLGSSLLTRSDSPHSWQVGGRVGRRAPPRWDETSVNRHQGIWLNHLALRDARLIDGLRGICPAREPL